MFVIAISAVLLARCFTQPVAQTCSSNDRHLDGPRDTTGVAGNRASSRDFTLNDHEAWGIDTDASRADALASSPRENPSPHPARPSR